jgi:tetratricopeptide (TPR) repeat protein
MAELVDISQAVSEFTALAKQQLNDGDIAAAEQTARAVISLAPKAADGWRTLGEILSAEPGRRGEAAEAFQKALALDPADTASIGGQQALSARETAAPQKPFLEPKIPQFAALSGKDALIADARAAEAAGRWQDAKKSWEAVLKKDPSDTWAWSQFGHLLSVNLHDFDGAEAAFRRAIEEDPTDDWAWGKLGIMVADFKGNVEEGQELLREAIRLDPNEPYYHGWLGWSLFRQSEQLEAAEKELSLAVKIQPDYQWAHFHLGYVRATMGDKPKEALTAYKRAAELDPSDIATLFNLGALYEEQLDRPRKAEQVYLQALKKEPGHVLSHFKLAALYERSAETYQKAKYHYQQILLDNPQDLAALRCLAFLYYEKLQAYSDAEMVFAEALRIAPDDADLHYRFGCLLWYELEKGEEGISHLERATELAPDIELGWASLGEAMAAVRGDYEAAEGCYKKALEIEPDYYWVLAHYGTMLFENMARGDDGLKALAEAVAICPDYGWGWLQLGRCHKHHTHDYEAARDSFERSAEIDEEDFFPVFEMVTLFIDHSYRPLDADPHCKKLTEMLPDNGLAWALYAYVHRFKENGFEEASRLFDKALELDGNEHWLLHAYGEHMLFDKGDAGEAEALFLKSNQCTHDCATINSDLGIIRLAQGEHDIARAFSEKALEEDPDNADCWRRYGRFLYLSDGDPALIEESFDRAIEEKPLNFENHLFMAVYLENCQDREEEAAASWLRAKELAPKSLDLKMWADLQMRPRVLRFML